jgi:hypothetical protein
MIPCTIKKDAMTAQRITLQEILIHFGNFNAILKSVSLFITAIMNNRAIRPIKKFMAYLFHNRDKKMT